MSYKFQWSKIYNVHLSVIEKHWLVGIRIFSDLRKVWVSMFIWVSGWRMIFPRFSLVIRTSFTNWKMSLFRVSNVSHWVLFEARAVNLTLKAHKFLKFGKAQRESQKNNPYCILPCQLDEIVALENRVEKLTNSLELYWFVKILFR